MKIKCKVLKKFRNKYSKAIHKKDDIVEIKEGRLKEINSAGYGKLVEEIKEGD